MSHRTEQQLILSDPSCLSHFQLGFIFLILAFYILLFTWHNESRDDQFQISAESALIGPSQVGGFVLNQNLSLNMLGHICKLGYFHYNHMYIWSVFV